MKSLIRPALSLFLLLSVVTGLAYPAAVTGAARLLFPAEAAGSLVERNGTVVGSSLIGQSFSGPTYFWSRPSATGPIPDNAAASSGSNYGPLHPALAEAVKGRVEQLRAAHPDQHGPVPADLATASASGLDPHISPAAAYYQIERVAKARGMTPLAVKTLVDRHIEYPSWRIFGDRTVNVLELNLALDELAMSRRGA
ncbi:potassium-transporting ATPase subunit KdpC [Chitinimonas koreensis]|uniref:potassium-transporting ATPase subunit KdpC n=1 Tax=Chitinimonas koreensis TaxID=356302 RepID=UPI0003FEC77E|nr:potassium-transporting ATPase subunit KdpC [Chitinimonas koreensis]QNM94716.1 potassium-transporting ATPase subunit KdpC [Chitinimonas koreensis]